MSKLSHSNEETMAKIAEDRAREDGELPEPVMRDCARLLALCNSKKYSNDLLTVHQVLVALGEWVEEPCPPNVINADWDATP